MFAWELQRTVCKLFPRAVTPSSRACRSPDHPGLGVPSHGHGRELHQQDCVSFFIRLQVEDRSSSVNVADAALFRCKCAASSPPSPGLAPPASAPRSPFFPPAASAPSSLRALFERSLLPAFPTLAQLIQADFFL